MNASGAKVSDTIRKGIIDPLLFAPKELMLGQLASLMSKNSSLKYVSIESFVV
jgi:phosphate/sulfate permease